MAVALLVAAGSGERLGADRPKAFVTLGGKSMLQWSLEALDAAGIDDVVIAMPREMLVYSSVGATVVAGGAVRSESVRNALEASDGDPVVVHDAARPLAPTELFARVLEELRASGADGVVAAAPVTDTVKRARDGDVVETLDRSSLWAVQTPQAFRREALERALEVPDDVLAAATDDAWLVERAGGCVRVVEGDPENFKVTTPADLRRADGLLTDRGRLAVVRSIIDAVNQGRMEDPFTHYHEDVLWDTSAMPGVPDAFDEVHRGHEGLRTAWRDWLAAWETVHFEIEELFVVGDHVVQHQRQVMRGRSSGVELEMDGYAQVWSFRGEKVAAMRLFADRDEALRFAREH